MRALVSCLSLVALVLLSAPFDRTIAASIPESGHAADRTQPVLQEAGTRPILSSGTATLQRSADADTLYLYGGPGSSEGTFEDPVTGQPDWQGWTSVDLSLLPNHWQRSTFNAATLGNHGPGNTALWCGVSAEQEPGYSTAPGYGNSWNDAVVFEASMVDPSIGQDVELSFVFHHDSEPGYDYFVVQHDSAGIWMDTLFLDGRDSDAFGVFTAPGVSYGSIATGPIRFGGNDYGIEGDVLRLRLVFRSDGAYSDEDGQRPSFAGAVQVDDVLVRWNDGTGAMQEDLEDFEDEDMAWEATFPPFAGDFARLFTGLDDLDPCQDLDGAAVAFIDIGQPLCPPEFHPDCLIGTGGTLGSNPYSGIPWVVNYTGGLSQGIVALHNEVWSPPILWDLPTPDDDGPEWRGARLGFDVYTDLSLSNGIFYVWHLRWSEDGVAWKSWDDNNFVYYNRSRAEWIRVEEDVSDLVQGSLLAPRPIHSVQIALGVRDLADIFGLPGGDATIAPLFDNVAFAKYRLRGPQFRVREWELAQDGFPANGLLDLANLGDLDVRFDMASSVSQMPQPFDPGDSVVVRVEAIIDQTEVTEVRMKWVLDKNPLFGDSLRQAPSGPEHENVVTTDPLRWTGEVVGDPRFFRDQWAFDLPDQDFLYPGDVLRYRFLATDSDARVSTLPLEATGFLDGVGYDPRFTVRALPSLYDDSQEIRQPRNLFVMETGKAADETALRVTLRTLDFEEGRDYDVYAVRNPDWPRSMGLGAAQAHGATLAQIAGYRNLFLDFGQRSSRLLSDGSGTGSNDRGPDLGLLIDWHEEPGERAAIHFGVDFATGLNSDSSLGAFYLQNILDVEVGVDDIREVQAPRRYEVVAGEPPNFLQEYLLVPSCGLDTGFDGLRPFLSAFGAQGFYRDSAGGPDPDGWAAVIRDRLVLGDRTVDMTFSYTPSLLQTEMQKDILPQILGPRTTAAKLFAEIFSYLGVPVSVPPGADPARLSLEVFPSPFNPKTTVRLELPASADALVEIFDLRGRRVRTLFSGPLERAGAHDFVWDGRDDRGASLATGVYVVRAEAAGRELARKVALLK